MNEWMSANDRTSLFLRSTSSRKGRKGGHAVCCCAPVLPKHCVVNDHFFENLNRSQTDIL